MISWEHWQTLLAVYRAGSYAAAASTLRVNPTTVGRRIKHLENRLGGSLFIRHEGRLIPSDRCMGLLSSLEAASESLRAVENESADLTPHTIWREVRITAAPFLIQNLLAPDVSTLADQQKLRLELLGTGNNVSLSRREADIALRLEDGQFPVKGSSSFVLSELLGSLDFAVYHLKNRDAVSLPWAGILEEYNRSAGVQVMQSLVDNSPVHYKVRHFDALLAIVLSGAAKALLPCFMGESQAKLIQDGDVALRLPLWMLSHRQDIELMHLKATRHWIKQLFASRLQQVDTTHS